MRDVERRHAEALDMMARAALRRQRAQWVWVERPGKRVWANPNWVVW